MLRFVTVFFMILVIGVSAGLYHVTYSFDRMERQAMALRSQIAQDREAMRILDAEWSALNQPGRLQTLSERFLDLRPLEAAQIISFDGVPAKLADAAPPLSIQGGVEGGITAVTTIPETVQAP